MSQFVETPIKNFTAGAAIPLLRRVVVGSTGLVTLAGALDNEIGVTEDATFASGDETGVRLQTAQGTAKMTAVEAISLGAKVYGAASGKIGTTANSNFIGIANEASTADGDIIEIMRVRDSSGEMAAAAVAASAALTNTVTETALNTLSIPANSLAAGDVLRVRGQVIATATNSTDTLTVTIKIGSTVIITTGAVDVANNDISYIDLMIQVRTIGASGTYVATGIVGLGASGTITTKAAFLASTTFDTTAALSLTHNGTWSVASGSNSCRSDVFVVEHIRR